MTMNTRVPEGSFASGRTPGDADPAINLQDATVGDLVREVPHLRLLPDCPVEKVLSAMSSTGRQIAGIIEEDGTFAGFITRSTLIGKLVIDQGLDQGGTHIKPSALKDLTAADVMIRNPAFLPSELGVSDALAIMTEYGHPIMPVLGDRGELVGLAEMRQLRRANHIQTSGQSHQDDDEWVHSAFGMKPPVRTHH
jgi:CBS domain-containing protein